MGAVDAQLQTVLVADRHLARPQHAARPPLVAQQNLHIVVELATRHESRELRKQLIGLKSCDERGEIVGMRAEVANAATGPRSLRIGAPFGLLAAGKLGPCRQPVLRILGLHDTDRTELAGDNHRPCLPDHRIACVIVGEAEDRAGPADKIDQVLRIRHGSSHGFVADHVDAGLEKCARDGRMHMVWRHDRHRLDAVGPCRFGFRHLLIRSVRAVCGEADFQRRGLRPFWIGRQRTCYQLELVVDPRRDAVDRADERAFAAADHAKADAAGAVLFSASLDGHFADSTPMAFKGRASCDWQHHRCQRPRSRRRRVLSHG